MKFAFPVGHQVRLCDLLDGKLVRPALTFDLDDAIAGTADRPREIAPSLYPVRELDARALPRKPCKISFSPEGPIKPWRAHFQLVCMRYDIGDIERRRDVAAHTFAISMRDGSLSLFHLPFRYAVDE
jgi:hypothetical protein